MGNAGSSRGERRYELDKPEDARACLAHGHGALAGHQAPAWEWREAQSGRGILDWPALDGVTRPQPAAPPFTLSATLAIDGAVLIRHGFESESAPTWPTCARGGAIGTRRLCRHQPGGGDPRPGGSYRPDDGRAGAPGGGRGVRRRDVRLHGATAPRYDPGATAPLGQVCQPGDD